MVGAELTALARRGEMPAKAEESQSPIVPPPARPGAAEKPASRPGNCHGTVRREKAMTAPSGLRANIEAYEAIQDELERQHLGKYVVFHERKLVDVFETADKAITHALKTFGVAPYLVRRVGARRTVRLPASLALGETRADR